MNGKIQKWGNSQAVRLPKNILDTSLLKENDNVEIIAEENKIIIIKSNKEKSYKSLNKYLEEYHNKDINDILNEIKEENENEVSWGNPVGEEIW